MCSTVSEEPLPEALDAVVVSMAVSAGRYGSYDRYSAGFGASCRTYASSCCAACSRCLSGTRSPAAAVCSASAGCKGLLASPVLLLVLKRRIKGSGGEVEGAGIVHSGEMLQGKTSIVVQRQTRVWRHRSVHTIIFNQSHIFLNLVSTNPRLLHMNPYRYFNRYSILSNMRQVNSYLLSLCLLVAEYVHQQRPDASTSTSRDRSMSMEEVPTLSHSALNALARFLSEEIQQPLQDAPEEPLGAGSSF